MTQSTAAGSTRFHALDALRAFVLLLGVVYHAALSFVLPADGTWAVGTTQPSLALWWFIYYAHSFRMEAFFLLAGFFAALVVQKRGAAAFLRDRAQRILLVFVVLVYPMTFLVTMLWIDGGLKTGWLQLPPEVAAAPLWRIADGGIRMEGWRGFSLGHLWFLYYLAWICALCLALRAGVLRHAAAQRLIGSLDLFFRRAFASRLAPLWIALCVLPWLAAMPRYDVDSPVKGWLPQMPALAIFTVFFLLGWWLHRQADLLTLLGRRWKALLGLGLAMSFVAWGGEWLRVFGHADAYSAWASRFAVSLTMALSTLGWIGLFVTLFSQASKRIRYVADASYWVYLAHLPLVVALQIWLESWESVWIKLLVINLIALLALFASYHWWVRRTWAGRWLNGSRSALPARVAA